MKGDLVERRQRYIERQQRLHADAVDVDLEGREPMGTGPPNRHGRPKLPVGQREVSNWPVLDLGDVPAVGTDEWLGEPVRPEDLRIVDDNLLAVGKTGDNFDFLIVGNAK